MMKEKSSFRTRSACFSVSSVTSEFTALENIMIPALIMGIFQEATAHALEILNFMGLAERASHKPNELSGGENNGLL